jgi:hypothetical protein
MHDQKFEARVRQAFNLSMHSLFQRRIPRQVALDVSQETLIAVHDELFSDSWENVVRNKAMSIARKVVKAYHKEQKMLESFRDYEPREAATESRRLTVRNLAINTLTSREWQVIHRKIWRECSFVDIEKETDMSDSTAFRVYHKAMDNLKQAVRRLGLRKDNWREWYYEEMPDL